MKVPENIRTKQFDPLQERSWLKRQSSGKLSSGFLSQFHYPQVCWRVGSESKSELKHFCVPQQWLNLNQNFELYLRLNLKKSHVYGCLQNVWIKMCFKKMNTYFVNSRTVDTTDLMFAIVLINKNNIGSQISWKTLLFFWIFQK